MLIAKNVDHMLAVWQTQYDDVVLNLALADAYEEQGLEAEAAAHRMLASGEARVIDSRKYIYYEKEYAQPFDLVTRLPGFRIVTSNQIEAWGSSPRPSTKEYSRILALYRGTSWDLEETAEACRRRLIAYHKGLAILGDVEC